MNIKILYLICIESTQRIFQDFKTDISAKIKADILQEQQLIERTIKCKAFEYKKIKDKGDSKVWFYQLIFYISRAIKFSLT